MNTGSNDSSVCVQCESNIRQNETNANGFFCILECMWKTSTKPFVVLQSVWILRKNVQWNTFIVRMTGIYNASFPSFRISMRLHRQFSKGSPPPPPHHANRKQYHDLIVFRFDAFSFGWFLSICAVSVNRAHLQHFHANSHLRWRAKTWTPAANAQRN